MVKLNELHDSPAEYTQTRRGYRFHIGDNEYQSLFYTINNSYKELLVNYHNTINVYPKSEELEQLFSRGELNVCYFGFTITKDNNPYYDITSNTGNAALVISTVIDTVKTYVNKNHPDIITFGSRDINSKERSKYIAYKNIVRRLKAKYGYEYIEITKNNIACFFVMPDKSRVYESVLNEIGDYEPKIDTIEKKKYIRFLKGC